MIVKSRNDNISEEVQLDLESEGTVELSCPGCLWPPPAIANPHVW